MELLEQHFETAFDAPGGIQKLRELVLNLAIRGMLLPQNSQDVSASNLIQEISAEKKRLIKEEDLKTKASDLISPDEEYVGRPLGWEYCRLGNLAKFIDYRGKTPTKVDAGVPLITAKNVRYGFINREPYEYITEDEYDRWMTRGFPRMGDLLFTTEAPLGNIAVIDIQEKFALAQRVICLQLHAPEIAVFLKWLMMSVTFQNQLLDNATGMTAKGIKSSLLKEIPIPLPPLPEQRRIVAKIDQLMARCDELEKLRTERDQKRLTVHTAALNRLLTAQSSDSFTEAWQFMAQHFSELYSVKENVAELRKAILQLAVMGELVEQDPSDEPASELLKEIHLEKQTLIEQGKIKRSKPLPEVSGKEMPYALPRTWVWVRLGDISTESNAGKSPQCLRRSKEEDEWGVLKVSAVSWGEFNPDENKALPPNKDFRREDEVKVGDFLISRANTEELVARSVVVKTTTPKLLISDKTIRFSLSKNMNKQFVNIANLSEKSREYYAVNASGTSSSMKNVTRSVMCKLPIPLPPLLEQHRIVAKVDQLMNLCETLEQQIENATHKQTTLLNAVMAQV